MPVALHTLPAQNAESKNFNVVIETPKGSRNKFVYEPQLELFQLKGVLPEGSSFPYDFGFIPSTRGEDGDPIDVLVLMDVPAFAGCLLEVRLIGAIEAEQTENDGKVERNDRLLAVSAVSRQHQHIQDLQDLSPELLHEIEHFFHSYNEARGGEFKAIQRSGAERACELVRQGKEEFSAKSS